MFKYIQFADGFGLYKFHKQDQNMKLSIILLLLLNFSETFCEDEEEELDMSYYNYEYLNVFETVPSLFEYLLNLLEEKPEVLEQNDITVFTEDGVHNSEVSLTEADNYYGFHESANVLTENEKNNGKVKRNLKKSNFAGGINPIFHLTPEEVMEQVLIIEQQLEDYNSNKK